MTGIRPGSTDGIPVGSTTFTPVELELAGLRPAAFAYYRRLSRLKEFVVENYHRPISLGAAASHVGLEANYFSTYFHRKAGVCFWQWLAYVRVERAVELLMRTDLRVTRIAQQVGFEDVGTFERAFKRVTQMTPSTFRRIRTLTP